MIVPVSENVAGTHKQFIIAQVILTDRLEPNGRCRTFLAVPNRLIVKVTRNPVSPQFKPLLPRLVLFQPLCKLVEPLIAQGVRSTLAAGRARAKTLLETRAAG